MLKLISKIRFKNHVIILLLFATLANLWVIKVSHRKTYGKVSEIPENKVGLVLGTSKYLKNGAVNPYFKYRVDAAVLLFKNKKIEFILVSGDNGNENYDEPADFKNELVQNDIPPEKIFLDDAGFRTLDSVVRAKKVFGQDSITIISQKFHNQRAIFLAEHYGIVAVGFNAKKVDTYYGILTNIREFFARIAATIDVIFNIQPKFLGEKITIV